MSNLTWMPLSPAQCRALGRLGKSKDSPAKFIVAVDEDKNLVVVPASSKDRRRWDITRGGMITRSER